MPHRSEHPGEKALVLREWFFPRWMGRFVSTLDVFTNPSTFFQGWSFTTVETLEMLIQLMKVDDVLGWFAEGKPHTLTWTGGIDGVANFCAIQSYLSKRNFTGKARWQCPRALCTNCRHAISWWSPEGKARWTDPIWPLGIWELCINVFVKVWIALKSFCSRRCAYVCAILGLKWGRTSDSEPYWNVSKLFLTLLSWKF